MPGLAIPESTTKGIILPGLFGSRVLEAALGLTCIYLLLATFCSTVNEWIASLLAVRARMLEQGIARLLGDAAASFYQHPLIQSMMHNGAHPEHIAPTAFAKTVMDLATPNHPGSIDFEDLERGIANDLPLGALRSSLLAVIQGTEKRMDDAQRAIEKWFDDAMDGVSRRYKRQAQLCTTLIAIAVTAAMNADSIRLSRALLAGKTSVEALGWDGPGDAWLPRIAGWLLTIAAVSLGAPFWFDATRNLLAVTRPRLNSRDN
jgi:hypothetical protein